MKNHWIIKRFLACLMVVLMTITAIPMSSFVGLELPKLFATKANAASEGNYTYTVSDGKATITDCNTSISGDIVIPNKLGKYPVTSIGDRAFKGCTGLTSATISNGIKSIGSDAFYHCVNLTNVIIPNSIVSIKDYAFTGCVRLKKIIIPDSVTKMGKSIFLGCESLLYAKLPKKVKTYDSTFDDCGSLEFVEFPDGTTKIGKRCLIFDYNLKNVYIPASVKNIDDCAFQCYMYQNINIYYGGSKEQWKKIKVTGDNEALQYAKMHYNCDSNNIIVSKGKCGSNLEYKLDIRGNLTISGTGKMKEFLMYKTPWHDFPVLTVTLKEGITSLCDYAFADASISRFTAPKSLVSIGNNCFHQCYSLADVEISSGVTDIKNDIFYDCENLTSIKVDKKNPKYYSKNNCIISRDTKTLIRGCADSIIPSDVKYIASHAFSGTKMSSIKIPDSVKEIGWEVFNNCRFLKSISLPDGIKEIDVHCFAGCAKLTSIIIPSSITYIDEGAFFDCKKLSKIYFKGTKTQWKNIKINRKNEQLQVISFGASYGDNGWEFTEKPLVDKNVFIDNAKVIYVCNCFNPKNYTTKATTTKDGKTVTSCSVCGKVIKTVIIPKVSSIKLSASKYAYDGKTKTPSVTVKDSNGKTLQNGTDYTVKYSSGRKAIGQYTVTVTFKGNYSGTKKLSFTIAPKAPTLKVTAGSKKAALSWSKQTGATGYVVYMATSKNGKYSKVATVKGNSKTSYTKTDLTKGKTYYFKVAAYSVVNNKTIYGGFSSVKSVKIK